MQNMSDRTKQALTGTLKDFIQQSDGLDRTALHKMACDMFTTAFGDRPQLAKVACQTYNSQKTIHEISSRPLDKRASDIDLLDPEAVYEHVSAQAAEPLRKVASGVEYSFSISKNLTNPTHGFLLVRTACDRSIDQSFV